VSDKSKSTTFLLCYFLGALGIHRFYVGKLITGVLMLVTGGGFVIWWLIDLYRIITGRFKDKQGDDLRTSQPDPEQPNAGFWVRLSAFLVDGVVLGVVVLVFIDLPLMAYLFNSGIVLEPDNEMAVTMAIMAAGPILMLASAAATLLYVVYFVALTAGKHQGTYGKRSMGIYVRNRSGDRVWIGGSLARFVGYIVSWIPLGLGFLMVAFQKRKLALHDLIAGTEVVYGIPSAEVASVEHEPATEVARPEPLPLPAGFDDAELSPSRVPEILVGTGLLLITGAMALSYMR
jgi:uncharacterized RDD family membrane protein YckC